MFGGGVESLHAYADHLQPYYCADHDALLAEYRCADGLWTPFSALPVVLIYNTKLVQPGQLSGWGDLLAPQFKGRVAFADPSASGSSFTSLVTMLHALGGDADTTIRTFAQHLNGAQTTGSGEVLTAVADGVCLVGITLEETALKRMAEGADLALVYPEEGTSAVPDGSALVRGAPHEENAKLFLDFTTSADVQQHLADQFYRRSVRSDIQPAQGLSPLNELPLMDYDVTWASENHDPILMSWAFYLGWEEAQ